MKILIIGGGGREHALAHTFHRQGHTVWTFPGNAGTEEISQPLPSGVFSMGDLESLAALAVSVEADLTVVGPEQPLAEGIVDLFQSKGLRIFGPTKQASVLEADKAWSKAFMDTYNIPTAPFVLCTSEEEATEVVRKNFAQWKGCVIKPCGLTAGKGVMVCHTEEEAYEAIKTICSDRRFGDAGDTVVVEKLLVGKELSLLAFCDGKSIVPMLPSQDHKKLFEGDEGPNTGGIGAYAPAPFATAELMRRIDDEVIAPTAAGLAAEEINYCGIIYFGLMITDDGIYMLEYNCRFGDPETQAILPLLDSDLATIMNACIDQSLTPELVQWSSGAACCVVIAVEGYPFTFPTGDPITGFDQVPHDVVVFHAGTRRTSDNQVVTTGGRVIGVTGLGASLLEAIEAAYRGVQEIDFVSAYYRRDIGYQAVEAAGKV